MLRVKEIREDRGLTQAQLALAVGVGVTHISRIENDRVSPSVSVAKRIADALGVSLDYLVVHDDPEANGVGDGRGKPHAGEAAAVEGSPARAQSGG